MSLIKVVNKKTGKTRMMGEAQLKLMGKKSDWSEVRKAEKPKLKKEVTEKPTDEGNGHEDKTDVSDGPKSNDEGVNVITAVSKIKELSEAGDIEGLKNYIAANETRITVLAAYEKFLPKD